MSKRMTTIMAVLITAIIVIGASWGICCGLLKLISMCFGLKFSIKVATGIWLVIAFVNFFMGKKKATNIKED